MVSVHGVEAEVLAVGDCGGNVCEGLGGFHVLVPFGVVLLGTLITLMVGYMVVKLLGDILCLCWLLGVFWAWLARGWLGGWYAIMRRCEGIRCGRVTHVSHSRWWVFPRYRCIGIWGGVLSSFHFR